jgi:Cupin-like domain
LLLAPFFSDFDPFSSLCISPGRSTRMQPARFSAGAVLLLTLSAITFSSSAADEPIYTVVKYSDLLRNPDEYLTGTKALIIKGATRKWEAIRNLSPELLMNVTSDFGDTNIGDWYPDSMHRADVHPFLVQMDQGFKGIRQAGAEKRAAYLQWRLPLRQAERVLDLMKPFPFFLRSITEDAWMPACLKTRAQKNNFMMVIAWYMMVIGVEGGGMFLHPDNYDSGTWQVQLLGTKEWTLCDPGRVKPEKGESLQGAGYFDTFAPGFSIGQYNSKHPDFPHGACTRILAEAGDILVYPSRWWHQTRIPPQENLPLDHPNRGLSIGLAGRWVNKVNFREIANAVEQKCNSNAPDISLQYKGAAPNPSKEVCEAVKKDCMEVWINQYEKPVKKEKGAAASK